MKMIFWFIVSSTLLLLICIVLLAFGNPQWNKYIYLFQADYYPKSRQMYKINNKDLVSEYAIPPKTNYTGVWSDWEANGKLMRSITYRNGTPHGLSLVYHRFHDSLLIRGYSYKGKTHGPLKIYDESGNIAYSGVYVKGEKVACSRSRKHPHPNTLPQEFVDDLLLVFEANE